MQNRKTVRVERAERVENELTETICRSLNVNREPTVDAHLWAFMRYHALAWRQTRDATIARGCLRSAMVWRDLRRLRSQTGGGK